MNILQTDLKAAYLAQQTEIDAAIHRVLQSGWYILGQEVESFEQAFAHSLGVQHVIGVASGTDALEIALRACNIGNGDAVITVSHTAVATVAAIELVGATPILIDVDPQTMTMDLNQLEEQLKCSSQKKIRAMIPVHLYGHPVKMSEVMKLAETYGVKVIEDCAQSHGATYEGHQTGSWGHLAAFSFYPTKNLGALGDGGVVATSQPELAEKIRSLREYGWQERYISQIPGMNSRLDPLQAAILKVKLTRLDTDNQRRQEIAQAYHTLLSSTSLQLPQKIGPVTHVYHQYVVRHPHRDNLRAWLKTHTIGTLIHYPLPVHQQPAYQGRVTNSLPHTEKICREIISLPMHPHLTDAQIHAVSDIIKYWNESLEN